MDNNNRLIAGIAVVAALLSATAHAGTITHPALSGSVIITDTATKQSNTWQLPGNSPYIPNADGTFTYQSSLDHANWGFTWDISVDPDPFISAVFSIANHTSVTRNFDLLFTLPVGAPFGPAGYKKGSLSAAFEDSNLSGGAALNNIMWSGRMDGVAVMSLLGGSFACGGAGCNFTLSPVSDGPLPSTGVDSSIGLRLAFDLSAGDRATFNTFFEVTPVPLPAALWLLASGVFMLLAFSRKKK